MFVLVSTCSLLFSLLADQLFFCKILHISNNNDALMKSDLDFVIFLDVFPAWKAFANSSHFLKTFHGHFVIIFHDPILDFNNNVIT